MKILLSYPRYFLRILGTVALCVMGITGTTYAGDVEELYRAAGDGKATEVAGLLKSGVNVNGRTRSGSYALNAAAVENNTEVIQMLLAYGADPNVQNRQGDTPLICATKYAGGKSDTVKLLVDAGTDREIRDNSGNTALDYAMAKEQKDAIGILVRRPVELIRCDLSSLARIAEIVEQRLHQSPRKPECRFCAGISLCPKKSIHVQTFASSPRSTLLAYFSLCASTWFRALCVRCDDDRSATELSS